MKLILDLCAQCQYVWKDRNYKRYNIFCNMYIAMFCNYLNSCLNLNTTSDAVSKEENVIVAIFCQFNGFLI